MVELLPPEVLLLVLSKSLLALRAVVLSDLVYCKDWVLLCEKKGGAAKSKKPVAAKKDEKGKAKKQKK